MECIRNKCKELFGYTRISLLKIYEEDEIEENNDDDFNIKDIL